MNVHFELITVHDKEKINALLKQAEWMKQYVSSELVFENLFAWSKTEDIRIAWFEHFAILKCFSYGDVFLPPIAGTKAHFMEAIDCISSLAKYPTILGLVESMLHFFTSFKGLILDDDMLSEYIYEAKDLIDLEGRLFHRKRNQLNQFKKKYAYEFITYHHQLDDVKDLLQRYLNQGGSDEDEESILNILTHHHDLDIFIDLLYVSNVLVGLSISTISMFGHGVVLFEKADINYVGTYTAISSFTAIKHFQHVTYITRQEDLGIPQLRRAKLSYNPIKKDKKFVFLTHPVTIQLYNLYQSRFHDSKAYTDYYFLHYLRLKNVYYYEEKKEIRSALHLLSKNMYMNGQIVPTYLLCAAATKIGYEKRGYMKKVVQKAFDALYQQEIPFIVLYPINHVYYESLGFIPYTTSIFSESNLSLEVSLEQTLDVSLLNELYEKKLASYEGYMIRTDEDWNDYINLAYQDNIVFDTIKKDNEIIGYVAHDDQMIEELVIVESVIPIHPKVDFKKYIDEQLKHDIEHHMIRIINLKKWLLNYQYPKEFNETITLKINDPYIKENQMVIALHIENGQATIEPSFFYQYEINIDEFAKIIFTQTHASPLKVYFPSKPMFTLEKY